MTRFKRELATLGFCFVLLACAPGSPMTVSGLTILRYGSMGGGPTAQTSGVLDFASGCTRIRNAVGAEKVLLWPGDARLDTSAGFLRVVVGGNTMPEGATVMFGGGEYKDIEAVEALVGTIPPACVFDRYWLVTDIDVQ